MYIYITISGLSAKEERPGFTCTNSSWSNFKFLSEENHEVQINDLHSNTCKDVQDDKSRDSNKVLMLTSDDQKLQKSKAKQALNNWTQSRVHPSLGMFTCIPHILAPERTA
jgi:hypothetical protein